jgi:GntR family transcriptional regulator, transcriptional repressor for pyruvate dehydrogenase complex
MANAVIKKSPKARFGTLGNKNALVDRVVQSIQEQILSERLAVGTRLPPERELADRLGVSRTVIREAVCVLVATGLIETRHGIGSTVRALSRNEVVKPLTLFLRTWGHEVSLEHLHQVRSILEVENAGLAAEQASEEDVEDLRRITAEMSAAMNDPTLFSTKDSEFHRRLAETTHNPLLTLLLDSLRDLMAEVRSLVAKESGLFERVMPAHIEIVECVAARDVAGARKAMRGHLRTALDVQRKVASPAPQEMIR